MSFLIQQLIQRRHIECIHHLPEQLVPVQAFLTCEPLAVYLSWCLPKELYIASGVRMLPLYRILEEITELAPGAYIFPFGYLPIATSVGGNCICVDRTGTVWWADHGHFMEDEIVFVDPNTHQWVEFDTYTEKHVQQALVLLSTDVVLFLQQLLSDELQAHLDKLD